MIRRLALGGLGLIAYGVLFVAAQAAAGAFVSHIVTTIGEHIDAARHF